MDRLRKFLRGEQPYEPIREDGTDEPARPHTPVFSYVDYSIFLLLGVSMLWAWNMFLAAGPYFQRRFRNNDWIFNNFQAAEISAFTATNLCSMLVLTRLQANASYPKRIVTSLFISMAVFALLALSTSVFLDISAVGYFVFLMIMLVSTSFATGLCQNGIFAYVSGFGQPTYTQGIMTGQAIAGVLPCIAQIVSVLSNRSDATPPSNSNPDEPPEPPPVRSSAALMYFLTATAVALATLFAFLSLLARHRKAEKTQDNSAHDSPEVDDTKKAIPLRLLFRKLRWLAMAVFITFGVTMVFPVFTQKIVSVRPIADQPPLLQAPSFIPLALLFWNIGDLLGRLITAVPNMSLIQRPRLVFALAVSRIIFVGLYHLCNIGGEGAVVKSDFFYLVVVQLFFGISNGYLGSICMIGAGEWVEKDEQEAAGSFMALCLVSGLCVGSLLSFFAAG